MREFLHQHGEAFDLAKVTVANSASLAISLADVESCLSVLVLAATLFYTVMKVRAHTCKKCNLGVRENCKKN